MNSEQATKIITMLAAAYPNQALSTPTMQVYTQFLSDLSYEQAQAAVIKHIATSKFFPRISEIRQAALEVSLDKLPAPAEAWNEAQKQIRLKGYTGKPDFSNPLIAKTVDAMGGWMELCQSEEPTGVIRAHFLRIYEGLAESEADRIKTATLLDRVAGPQRPQLTEVTSRES